MKITLRLAGATLATITALGGLALGTPITASAACDPATRSLQYLATHQGADGSIDQSLAETADFVLGATADGIDPNTLTSPSGKTPFDFFSADLGTASPKAYTDANQLGKLIQAVVAGRHDPQAFASRQLLKKLTDSTTSGGMYNPTTGAYLDSTTGSNQAFTEAQAILALAAAHNAGFPVPALAVAELRSLRRTAGPKKGGWAAFGSFDTNTTSQALMALHAAGDTAVNDSTVYSDGYAFLHTQQDPGSGGFLFSTDFSTASDPDSDALVIQALTAAGENPRGPAWTNARGNAPADILSFQDAATGGFVFDHAGKVQAFATSQVPAGLKAAPFPVTGTYVSGAKIPPAGCGTAVVDPLRPPASPVPALPAAGHAAPSDPWLLLSLLAVPPGLLALGALMAPAIRRRR